MSEFFFSPCPRGLESVLADELRKLGASHTDTLPGGVAWRGTWQICYRVNLESRIATRVLWQVGRGQYRTESDVYKLAYSVTWAKWFTAEQTIRVFVTAQRSPLKSLEFITLRIKDAICDHFRAVTGRRPSVDTRNPAVRIHAFFNQEHVTLYLDTSGEPLYKRGFKTSKVEAPLKENLAAGILMLSGWQPGTALLDPMCGSGTFLLEAAQMALGISPGMGRQFAFEHFRHFDSSSWRAIRSAAQQKQQPSCLLPIYGSDRAGEQIRNAKVNLESAGLEKCVHLQQADILNLMPPESEGTMVTNPPYGVRLGEQEDLAAFYPLLGDTLKKQWAGWRCLFFSADTALQKRIGLRASRRVPLFNGALECRVYEYRMVSGRLRPDH